MRITILYLFLIFLLTNYSDSFAQQLAFPGAEGFGKYATGGRGGKVYTVTNLNDAGAGSFREAFNAFPGEPLTIVFAVGGIIELQSQIKVNRSNFTIAGQTAPGDGICLKGHSFIINGARAANLGGNHGNIIIRHLRSRPGSTLSTGVYGFDLENCHNVIIDHCSFSWANEECAAMYDMENVTVQYSIISEGLFNAGHAKGNRGYGGVWGGQYTTYHHNLFAHLNARSTRFNGARAHDVNALIDYRNNVIYNAGTRNAAAGGAVNIEGAFSRINLVNNYYKPGPATPSDYLFLEADYEPAEAKGVGEFFVDGNIMHGKTSQTNDNWTAVSLAKIPTEFQAIAKSNTAFAITSPLPVKTAAAAYADVLKNAGAFLPVRDAVDKRIVSETATGTASVMGVSSGKAGIIDAPSEVGSWPVYNSVTAPVDTDGDGMPDDWELANSLNPNDPADGNAIADNGYTELENYLNAITAASTTPYQILGFAGVLNPGTSNTVTLKASISNDIEIQNISVERSADGISYVGIGNITTNNSNDLVDYVYSDSNPLSDNSYYRLKITGKDASINYSNVIKIVNPIAEAYWTEPFDGEFQTTVSKPATSSVSKISTGSWTFYAGHKQNKAYTGEGSSWADGTNPSVKMLNYSDGNITTYTMTKQAYLITPVFSKGISKITFNEINRSTLSANGIKVYTSIDGGTSWSTVYVGSLAKSKQFDLLTIEINSTNVNRLKIVNDNKTDLNIDNITVYAPVGVTLPLKLVSFHATLKTGFIPEVVLNWETTNEVNTLKFAIERSSDGEIFSSVGDKKSNNTPGIHHYSFTDKNPLQGINYYRLKQIDENGAYTYSDIKVINNKSKNSFSIYPNPALDHIQIKHPAAQENATIVLYSSVGKKIKEIQVVKNAINSSCSVSNLVPGIYFIQLNNGNERFTEKFIKQ